MEQSFNDINDQTTMAAEVSVQDTGGIVVPAENAAEHVENMVVSEEVIYTEVVETPVQDDAAAQEEGSGSYGGFLLGAVLLIAACAVAFYILRQNGMLYQIQNGMLYQMLAKLKRPGGGKPSNNAFPVTETIDPVRDYKGPTLDVGMAQTIGDRPNQQDAMYSSEWKERQVLATRGFLAAVADGIGGLERGDIASTTAMKTMRSRFASNLPFGELSDRLLDLAAAAHNEVLALNQKSTSRCGTTLVSLLISDWKMVFLSVGDSRIYLYRSGAFLQLNREHTNGLTHQEQRAFNPAAENALGNPAALTSCLGKENLKLIDRSVRPITLLPGDRLVLMSDGVFGTLADEELLGFMQLPSQTAAESIIQAVENKKKKHQDNASVMIVHVE